MTLRRLRPLLSVALMLFSAASVAGAPPSDAVWTALLRRHVVVVDGGHASRVD